MTKIIVFTDVEVEQKHLKNEALMIFRQETCSEKMANVSEV